MWIIHPTWLLISRSVLAVPQRFEAGVSGAHPKAAVAE
jgi:hypothetical protein